MSLKRDISIRVAVIYLAVLLFGVVIAVKVVFLQFVHDDVWKEKAEKTIIQNRIIEAHRGDIYADDMRLLSSSMPYYQVRLDFKVPALTREVFYNNVDSLSYYLWKLFRDKGKGAYKDELIYAYRKGYRYYLLKDNVNHLQLKELRTFPIFRKGRYKGGFMIEQKTVRKKPHNSLASRTIGRYKNDSNMIGLEGGFNKYLAGQQGYMRMQKLSGGFWMRLDDEDGVEPNDGSSIVTTINVELQDVAESALRRQLTANNAKYGSAIVMEVETGDIKAIVNLKRYPSGYYEDYNYAIAGRTEPGSTFKLPVLMAAMEDGYIDINDTINTSNGRFKYYDMVFEDEHPYGKISVQQVLEKSSNVGMAMIVTRYYKSQPHRLIDRLIRMNLNQPLGIPIEGERNPFIPYPGQKNWSGVSIASLSRGYEVSLTPLQMLTFYNAVANDGKMVKPRFVKEVRKHGRIERVFHTEVINPSICSKSTLKKARLMLEGVVENGTATNLKGSSLKIAGKTGTAQIWQQGVYKRDGKSSYQASFAGYFPAEKPKYSCIVVINAPSKHVYYGNLVAGPVFQEIANKVYATNLDLQKAVNEHKIAKSELPYSKNGTRKETLEVLSKLNIDYKEHDAVSGWVSTHKAEEKIELSNKKIVSGLMPNVVSMGISDAVFLLENLGLKVKVLGRGSIKRQSIPVGTRIKKGQTVLLELSFIES
ncbi:MAG: transpeptidase family protein [Bacteroidales bacterium]|nr:transpeptidase family protein [Bacteroidales bacterium]